MNHRHQSAVAESPQSAVGPARHPDSRESVNDVHGQLNPTRVSRIVSPRTTFEIQDLIWEEARHGRSLAVAGHRHAMGGQQFASDHLLLDTRRLNDVLSIDQQRGIIEVRAGIDWPTLVNWLNDHAPAWSIRQKQTGADRLTLGGAVAANIHGRVLNAPPFVNDIESLTLVGPCGDLVECSRTTNRRLFSLIVGGYGLFGVVAAVRLRLAPRTRIRRIVEILHLADLMPAFEDRRAHGFTFGDFQFTTDETSQDWLRRGVFSCYQPLQATPGASSDDSETQEHRELSEAQWRELVELAHVDRRRAFDIYSRFYLQTNGQTYWCDRAQMSVYLDDYPSWLSQRLNLPHKVTDVITEVYVPRESLVDFMADAARDLRRLGATPIYGTIRLIERDEETFLPWARQAYACIIFNLQTAHTAQGLREARLAFRRLIDLALQRGGSFYLTYHRWATKRQILAAYPQFIEFLRLKRQRDPHERFQSDWYRHHCKTFGV